MAGRDVLGALVFQIEYSAWRLCHIGVGCLANRASRLFPETAPPPWTRRMWEWPLPFPTTADGALAFLDDWWDAWRRGLLDAGEEELWSPIGDREWDIPEVQLGHGIISYAVASDKVEEEPPRAARDDAGCGRAGSGRCRPGMLRGETVRAGQSRTSCRSPAAWDRVSASGMGPGFGLCERRRGDDRGPDQLGRISSALLGDVSATDEMALDPLHPYRAGDRQTIHTVGEPTPPATGPEA